MPPDDDKTPAPGTLIGYIQQVWRYPVKSMHGELLNSLELGPAGVLGDRLYAFESSEAPPGMLRVTSDQRRRLLRHVATTRADGSVKVLMPDGVTVEVDDAALLGRLGGAPGSVRLTRAERPQTDVRPLSLISVQTLRTLASELGRGVDVRRFRANLVLDMPGDQGACPEDALVGRTLEIGEDTTVRVLERDPRCRFITYDPDTTVPDPELIALLHRRHQGRAGVYAAIERPGKVHRAAAVVVQ